MARISGVDLPANKRIEVGLTYIYGIGLHSSKEILEETGVDPERRVKDLTDDEINSLRKELDKIRAEYTGIKKEAERAQKKELELQEQILKQKEWTQADKDKLDRTVSQNVEVKNELLEKEKELKIEFSKNVGLNKQLKDLNQKIQELEKDKKEKFDESERLSLSTARIAFFFVKNKTSVQPSLSAIPKLVKVFPVRTSIARYTNPYRFMVSTP